jgi:hypothetical protein
MTARGELALVLPDEDHVASMLGLSANPRRRNFCFGRYLLRHGLSMLATLPGSCGVGSGKVPDFGASNREDNTGRCSYWNARSSSTH